MPALRNACELRTLRQVELTLLNTYVGPTTGRRILAGRIRRGQIELLDAALMLCDLRGFTDLSNRLPTERVLELLNLYFDQVLPTITDGGGEVLKFMGDAVLAFFHRDDAAEACRAALEAALAALDRLDRLAGPGGPRSGKIQESATSNKKGRPNIRTSLYQVEFSKKETDWQCQAHRNR